jgi:hypothetical protein
MAAYSLVVEYFSKIADNKMGMVSIRDKIPSLVWGKLIIWLENRPFTKLFALSIYEAR